MKQSAEEFLKNIGMYHTSYKTPSLTMPNGENVSIIDLMEQYKQSNKLSDEDINKNFPIYGDDDDFQRGCRYGARWARDKMDNLQSKFI